MLKHAINRFTPEPFKTYLQEALCQPVANDPEVGDSRVHPYVRLERQGSTKWGTFGTMYITDQNGDGIFACETLENPWRDNKKKV
jgi:hypothetical protein